MGKIKKVVYGIGVVTGLALAGKGCLGMYRFSDAQQSIEDHKTTSNYLELKALADVDGNAELSEIERKLMYARLDENRSGMGADSWRWEDIAKRAEERIHNIEKVYWFANQSSRISHALAIYRGEIHSSQ